MGDLAELGVHASGEDDGPPFTRHQRSPGQQHVFCFQRRFLINDVLRAPRFGQRLAGNRRSVDAKVDARDQAAISRHVVAGFEQDQVAGHELLGR